MRQPLGLPSPLPALFAGLGVGGLTIFIALLALLLFPDCFRGFPKSNSIPSYARLAPQWTPDGNHIVFDHYDSNRSNRASIYVVRSDGSELKRISAGSEDRDIHYWPDISPNGSRIAYTTTRHQTKLRGQWQYEREIETSNLDGSDRRRLTYHNVGESIPAWSPDGTRIAFSSKNYNDLTYIGQVVVMEADGSNKRIVFDSETFDLGVIGLKQGSARLDGRIGGPVWSPNGETMSFFDTAYLKNRLGEYVYDYPWEFLFKAGANGQGLMPLYVTTSKKGPRSHEMAWSPDGRDLAFMRHAFAAGEAWSPDGRDTAIMRYASAAGELKTWILYAIGQDGSGLRKVAEAGHSGFPSSLSWSPNGDEILFVLNGAMYVAMADGSGLREMGKARYASWSPDGSEIAVVFQTSKDALSVYLAVVAPDGSDKRLLVIKEVDGSLKAARPGPKKCILWICW